MASAPWCGQYCVSRYTRSATTTRVWCTSSENRVYGCLAFSTQCMWIDHGRASVKKASEMLAVTYSHSL
eukprot:4336476-Prymnesium_polylepis.1